MQLVRDYHAKLEKEPYSLSTSQEIDMMGRQIKVYMHPADHAAVEQQVRELDAVLLAKHWNSTRPVELEHTADAGLGAFICHRSALESIHPMYIEVRDWWEPSVFDDPIIEWWFSKLDNDTLYPGRFYYIPEVSPSSGSGFLTDEFLGTADRLFRWVRRTIKLVDVEWGRERLGAHALDLHSSGKLNLHKGPPGTRY